ncbi:glycosyltransferase [uncultured Devosia sp.]|uniref:glycosyltransferase n=1 Tax=uncultured Devosia sp. TaxID=211434 RepID=UPI0035CC789A
MGELLGPLPDRQHVIALDENKGIAKAQNIGIAHAQERRVEYILLLDQDSVPSNGMVENWYRIALL